MGWWMVDGGHQIYHDLPCNMDDRSFMYCSLLHIYFRLDRSHPLSAVPLDRHPPLQVLHPVVSSL